MSTRCVENDFPWPPRVFCIQTLFRFDCTHALGGTTPGCSRVTDSAEPPPHFISHFCKTVFQQCFVSVNSSSSRTPLPAPRLNERQPQRVIQTQNQLHRDNTHGARGLHWQTLPPPPQPAAALCRQRRRHLAPCFGTPAACIGRCSIIVPWYFHLLERSAAFTRTRAAPCESDSSTPSTTTTVAQKPRALLCEDSMCGRERDRKRRTDGHTSPHAAQMPLLVLHAAELAEELGQSFSRRLVVKTGRVVWNNWLLLLHTAKSPLVQPMPMPCPDPNPR